MYLVARGVGSRAYGFGDLGHGADGYDPLDGQIRLVDELAGKVI